MNYDDLKRSQREMEKSQTSTWKNPWHALYSEIQDWRLRRIQTALLPSDIRMLKKEKQIQMFNIGALCGLVEGIDLVMIAPVITGVISRFIFPFNMLRPSLWQWSALAVALLWMPLYAVYQSVRCYWEARDGKYAAFLYYQFMLGRLAAAGVLGAVLSFAFWWLIPHYLYLLNNYPQYQDAINTLFHLSVALKMAVQYILGYITVLMGLPALAGYRRYSAESDSEVKGDLHEVEVTKGNV